MRLRVGAQEMRERDSHFDFANKYQLTWFGVSLGGWTENSWGSSEVS